MREEAVVCKETRDTLITQNLRRCKEPKDYPVGTSDLINRLYGVGAHPKLKTNYKGVVFKHQLDPVPKERPFSDSP